MIRLPLLLALAACTLPSAAVAQGVPPTEEAQETNFYPQDSEADFDFETAIAEARASNRMAVIVFGADWCHDSRALARVLLSSDFRVRFGERFFVTFIDVGRPKEGQGRNLHLVKQLGLKDLKSTPAMFVVSGKGKRLNSVSDARSWRNADKRGEAAILGWFDTFLATKR